jgi:hypothetical protein
MTAKDTAAQLLDAQVEFVLHELTGKRLATVIARDVDDLLDIAGELTVAEVVDADAAKGVLRGIAERLGGGALIADAALVLSDAIYDLPASADHELGSVVDRDPVEALIVKLLNMQRLHEEAMRRLNHSPLVATVAAKFIGKIAADFVAQQRQMAERVPGAKSLFSLGQSAANKVLSNPMVGDAANKGAKMAIKQTNSAVREVLKDAPLRGAAMEIWDLHADAPISDLRAYLTKQDLREIVVLVHAIITSGRASEWVGELVDACVDALLERYGERDVASLLTEAGITRDDVVADLRALLPPVIEAAKADGRLEEFVRARLKPFFASKKVQTILAAR